MTRDEAIERVKALPGWNCMPRDAARAHVDSLAALGLLNLDEANTDAELLAGIFVKVRDLVTSNETVAELTDGSAIMLFEILRRKGFKIVKAKNGQQ